MRSNWLQWVWRRDLRSDWLQLNWKQEHSQDSSTAKSCFVKLILSVKFFFEGQKGDYVEVLEVM